MILDSIINLFISFFSFLAVGAATVFVPVVNLFLAGVETVVGIFIAGFSLGRIERRGIGSRSKASSIISAVTLLLIAGFGAWVVLGPKIMNREITLTAADGHSLPFAALVVHSESGEKHLRTDNAGNITIPRFSTTAITVKDPRYVEKTWSKPEIDSPLTVQRSVLGSGLDTLAGHLLKPAEK